MSNINKAIEHLKENDIDAVEVGGILVIPYDYIHDDPDKFCDVITQIKGLLRDVDYDKSWQIDPYYYERKRNEDGSVVLGPEG